MTDDKHPRTGKISWVDLTVARAEEIRDFYREVTGWTADSIPMDGYDDFAMMTPGGECVAGICHARGPNAALPPQWLIYINVTDLDAGLAACVAGGGKILNPARTMGEQGRYAVIQDPAGAVVALFEPRADAGSGREEA